MRHVTRADQARQHLNPYLLTVGAVAHTHQELLLRRIGGEVIAEPLVTESDPLFVSLEHLREKGVESRTCRVRVVRVVEAHGREPVGRVWAQHLTASSQQRLKINQPVAHGDHGTVALQLRGTDPTAAGQGLREQAAIRATPAGRS